MARVAITEQYLTDIADAIRSKTGSSTTYLPSEMAPAILTISGSGGITPIGTINIIENGTYNVTNYASANVSVPTGSTINNQNKSVTPTESSQSITYDSGYTGLGTVTVGAISSTYVGSGITTNPTPTASGATVTIPAGYYSTQTTKSVDSGTAGTPTASKGTVSNHAVSVTPSVTNTAGYISGGTKTGTAVTISASELVSGNKAISSNGTNIDVTNYATVSVNVSGDSVDLGSILITQNGTYDAADDSECDAYNYIEVYVPTPFVVTISYNDQTEMWEPNCTFQDISDAYGSSQEIVCQIDTEYGLYVTGNIEYSSYNNTFYYSIFDFNTGDWLKYYLYSDGEIGTDNVEQFVMPYLQSITKTYTPTESTQTETVTFDTAQHYNGLQQVGITINAIPSNYVGSGIISRSSSDLTASGATVTVPAGYYASQATKSISNGSATGPSSLSASSATITTGTNTITLTKTGITTTPTVSAGYVSSATASTATVALTASVTVNPTPTASGATVTIPAGYYSSQTTKSVSSGSATAPSTISGTAASVSTGTNTLTLTKTVSVTPTVSAGYVSAGTAGNASVSLTASVTTKAAATYHPSTIDQTISASQYLTGAQTIKAVTITNLTAANIKKDVVVKIGDATDDDCVTTITGTYEGSGEGAALTVDTSTTTLNSAAASISFTGLAGEPTSFAVVSAADLATGASPWKTAAVVFDGTDLHGQTIRNTSNAQVSYDGTAFSKTYSNGTLTITGSGTNFQANQYKLVYTYGGSDIGTADVQVGSGATTITFTGLSEEPSYFSCIFKSNFSTSSGYQRVIVVVYDGTNTYGLEMDSGAHDSDTHWSYTYNNGSLTITSQGTNAGGYFHQPGYYQLTYATEGESGNYQSKTVYATSSQQVVQADSGYDALKKITIPAVTTTNLSASNILSGVTIQVGDAVDSDRIASVTGNVVLQNYYTGSSAPSSSTGSNGDLYLQS